MPIKVIIFDVDGVLLNTDEVYFSILQKALRDIRVKIDSKFYANHGFDDCIYDLSLSDKDIATVKRKISEQYYNDSIITRVRMRKGIIPILQWLSRVVNLAVGSGEEKSQINRYLNHFALGKFFTFIGHSKLVQGRKNNPKFFLKIATHFGVDPSECLHIGDTPSDEHALAAGVHVAIIPTKYSKYLSFDSRCHILKSIKSIPLLLKKEFATLV